MDREPSSLGRRGLRGYDFRLDGLQDGRGRRQFRPFVGPLPLPPLPGTQYDGDHWIDLLHELNLGGRNPQPYSWRNLDLSDWQIYATVGGLFLFIAWDEVAYHLPALASYGLLMLITWLGLNRTYRRKLVQQLAQSPKTQAIAAGRLKELQLNLGETEPSQLARRIVVDLGAILNPRPLPRWLQNTYTHVAFGCFLYGALLVTGGAIAASLQLPLDVLSPVLGSIILFSLGGWRLLVWRVNRQELRRLILAQLPAAEYSPPLRVRFYDLTQRQDPRLIAGGLLRAFLLTWGLGAALGCLVAGFFSAPATLLPQALLIAAVVLGSYHVLQYAQAEYRQQYRDYLATSQLALQLADVAPEAGRATDVPGSRGAPSLEAGVLRAAEANPEPLRGAATPLSGPWLGRYYSLCALWVTLGFGLPLTLLLAPSTTAQSDIPLLPYFPLAELLLPVPALLQLRRTRLEELVAHLRGLLER
jgi:hypothetical protein